jgi:hypothetical protein
VQLLEFKHIAPFEGCHWRWEYFIVHTPRKRAIGYPIVFADNHLRRDEIMLYGYHERGVPRSARFYWGFFGKFQVYEWSTALDEQVIPVPWWPAFWEFCRGARWVTFSWLCDECGEKQWSRPRYAGEMVSGGGTNYEPAAYLCCGCHLERENDQEARP